MKTKIVILAVGLSLAIPASANARAYHGSHHSVTRVTHSTNPYKNYRHMRVRYGKRGVITIYNP